MMDIDEAKKTLGDEFSFFFHVIHAQIGRLQLEKSSKILDVGTGRGRVATTLALSGYQVLTGEPAEDHSEYAKQAWRLEAQQVGVEDSITFRAFNAEKMPFDDQSFDAVFMMGALHHMSDPSSAVAECIRVLAPKGVISILEPNAALIELARTKYPDHPDPTDPTPFLKNMDVHTNHGEMFDIYTVRRANLPR